MFSAVHIEWRKSIYIVALITFKFCKHSEAVLRVLEHTMRGIVHYVLVFFEGFVVFCVVLSTEQIQMD